MFADKTFVKAFNTLIHIIIVFCAVVTRQGVKWYGKCFNQYILSVPTIKIVYILCGAAFEFCADGHF